MNNVLRLHEREETNYETGEILNSAVNVSEQRKLNDVSCLEFDYPMDEKARLIHENMLVSCMGRIYEIIRIKRIMDGRDIIHVTAEDMFSRRAKHTFLPNIPDMIGKKTSVVIKKALETAVKFSFYTNEELEALDMKWVGNDDFSIDFFSTDKTSLWDFLNSVIENCGRGEIYSNGMKFALVERIGTDRGVRLTLDKNMQNIDIERDTENIITRLYPFGSDDMHIGSVNKGVQYIDSPNKYTYGVHEGYKDYSDYTDPSKILANARWEFDPENEERIDIPKITITGKLIDLSKLEEYGDMEKVELGDTVHVYDLDGNEYTERVIEGTWHPFEPTETLISIGHMRRDLFFTLYQLGHTKQQLEAAQTTNKGIATRKIQGVVNSNRNPVKSGNEKLLLDGDLLVIKDSETNNKRLELGNVGGQFALNIYSADGKKLKIKLGEHGSNGDENYAFAIYDNKGNPAIYMDENGDLNLIGTMRGGKIMSDTDINVTKDATVGKRIILQDQNGATMGYEEAGIISVNTGIMQIIAKNNRGINLNTGGNIDLSCGSCKVNGIKVATKTDIDDMKALIIDDMKAWTSENFQTK